MWELVVLRPHFLVRSVYRARRGRARTTNSPDLPDCAVRLSVYYLVFPVFLLRTEIVASLCSRLLPSYYSSYMKRHGSTQLRNDTSLYIHLDIVHTPRAPPPVPPGSRSRTASTESTPHAVRAPTLHIRLNSCRSFIFSCVLQVLDKLELLQL